MKITVITPLFALSGVPLAQVRLARVLADRGHEVDLIIGNIQENFTLPKIHNVNVVIWNKLAVRSMLIPMIRYLHCHDQDVIFSAEDHLNATVLLAALIARSKVKITGSSRVTPFDTYSNNPLTKRWVLKVLIQLVMRRANVLTCVSKDMVKQYRKIFPNAPHSCVYNIVDDKYSRMRMLEDVDHPWLLNNENKIVIAAGRLAPWKGFDDLVNAFYLLKENKNLKLLILGDGPQRYQLECFIQEKGLSEIIELVGYVNNPLKYFKHAEVFVLTSIVEGLPNVLVEAMMCGCTPVSTDCPTGPREVLRDGKYGYLVPVREPRAIAKGIMNALKNPIPSELLQEAITPFKEEAVLKRHFELLGISE